MARASIFFCLLLAVVAAVPKRKNLSSSAMRIVGGELIDIEEAPYQVSLFYKKKHWCGGSIIAEKYVLTAAHCVQAGTTSDYSIRVGSKSSKKEGKTPKVKTITSHPDYDAHTVDYDIAIIELKKPLKFGNKIKKIPLAETEPKVGEKVFVTGWGAVVENGTTADSLSSVTLTVIDREVCKKLHDKFSVITPNMFCAGVLSGGKDACQGDSGGPAVVDQKLAGITSWGNGCARENSPAVFTNVAEFQKWIKSIAKI